MPKATRKGDIGSSHGCFPPSPAIEGSGDVFINGKPAVRVGDAYAAHGCGVCAPHGRNASQGSATVNINGKPSVRVDDAINCGGSAATGSGNVFIGDLSWGGQASLPVKPKLRLQLSMIPGQPGRPYVNEPYELYVDGALMQIGETDEEGFIEYSYDPPWNKTLKITTRFGDYDFHPDAMSPVETEAGQQQRLDALGYYNDDGEQKAIDTQNRPAVEYFQSFGGDVDNTEKNLSDKIKSLMP